MSYTMSYKNFVWKITDHGKKGSFQDHNNKREINITLSRVTTKYETPPPLPRHCVPCLKKGTLIKTIRGFIPIETLT